MNKVDIVGLLHKEFPDTPKMILERFVSSAFDEMSEALQSGRRIELRGFGTLSLRTKRARSGRNPKTGESVFVQEKVVPLFKTGKALFHKMNA